MYLSRLIDASIGESARGYPLPMTTKSVSVVTVISGALLFGGVTYAEKKTQAGEGPRETVARPLTDKERRKREDKLSKELKSSFGRWMKEDVGYIITEEERQAFNRLNTDDERQNFIEQFWLRRDPTPDTVENEFKE